MGDGLRVASASPIQVLLDEDIQRNTTVVDATASNWIEIKAGCMHTCAVHGTGDIYCMGESKCILRQVSVFLAVNSQTFLRRNFVL